ncbi:MAG: hypothetical protein ACR2JV_06180 [Gaiellales bacterium]
MRARFRATLPPAEFAALNSWLSCFYPYQLRWLLDWGRFALLLKARQLGASHTVAGDGVLWGAFLGETTTVISVGEREALEVLDKAERHARVLERLGSRWARATRKGQELRFVDGGRVVALPATSGGRSYSGNVILDEFAYQQRPDDVWDGAAAVVLHGYKLRVISTPNGVGNLFHKLWTDPKAHEGYSRHRVTIDEARADGLPIDDAECWKMSRGDPRVYDQLFRCAFLDNDAQYIPSAEITACSSSDLYVHDGDCYAGLDIGRTNDLTVLVVVKVDADGVRVVQRVESRKRTSQGDLDDMVERAFADYGVRRLCVDATGIGAFPAEAMQRRYGRRRVEPVVFTLASKEDLATGLSTAFFDRSVRLPATDAALRGAEPGTADMLRDDLCSIRRIVTSAGNVRYDAPHTDAGHADRAWALALALHACRTPPNTRREPSAVHPDDDYPDPA